MNTYLLPFCKKIRSIYDNAGIEFIHPKTGEKCFSKLRVLLVIPDAPARASVQNRTHHNSSNGCDICDIETSSIVIGKDKNGKVVNQNIQEFTCKRGRNFVLKREFESKSKY